MNNNLNKKLVIITGANKGLGFYVALNLAKNKNYKIILACRDINKGKTAKLNILNIVENANLEVMELDLSSLKSVDSFYQNYIKKYQRVDILINNAGIMDVPYSKTIDGVESQFATNYLGHFLLTAKFFKLFPNSKDSRIVQVSSLAHKLGVINFEDLQFEIRYSRRAAYSQSKLACLIFADELNNKIKKIDGKKIISICAHPGISNTELLKTDNRFTNKFIASFLIPLVGHSPAQAALSIVHAAISDDVNGGDYIGPKGFFELSGLPGIADKAYKVIDQNIADELWNVSEKITNFKFVVD